MSSTRFLRGLLTRSSRLAMTAVAVIIAVMSSLLAGVVLATPAGAATGASLDQCANGPLADPVDCTDAGDWVNGNLVASKAHFFEGDSVPYRMLMTGLTPGTTYTVTVEWDTTKGGMHALDYITTFDRTVAGADPCAGIAGCGGTPSTFPIPADPNVTNAGVTQIPGEFTLYGGTITAVSPYTLSGTYAGDSSTRITVTFVATSTTSVLAWGGHISTRQDWGMANSAIAISGSPYHTRLIQFDGKGGNQDRSLAAAAVIFPASITIIKDAVPDDAQDFSFSTTGGLLPATFSLDDDADPTLSSTQTFSNITTFGPYTITEAAAAGWTQTFGTPPCTVTSPNGGSQNVNLATVTLDLREGENVTCTFINTRQSGTLTVNKVVSPAGDPGLFNLEINGATAGTGGNVGDGGTTGTIPLATGTYTVGESAANPDTNLNNYTTDIACTGGITAPNAGPLQVTVGNGQNVVCTITNVRRTGTITVNKVLSPASDDGRFDLLIDGTAPNVGSQGVGDGGTTTAIALQPGLHSVGEIAAVGTDLDDYSSSISCSDGTVLIPGTTVMVDLSSGENIVCTITNVRTPGTITVNKVLSPAGDEGRFDLLIDGAAPNAGSLAVGDNGTTGAVALQPGAHSIGEVAADGTDLSDYTSTIVCDDAPAVPGPGPVVVQLASGQDIVCTITNVRHTGTITINKVLSPADDPGLFNLQIDGATAGTGANAGDGGTTGAVELQPGLYTVGEVAAAGSPALTNYTTSIVCDNDPVVSGPGPLAVTLASDQDIVCTITNIRQTGTLTVNKVLSPANDPGLFNLQIDGATAGTGANVGNGGTTGAIPVVTGVHTVRETAGTNTQLSGYTSSIACSDGTTLLGSGGPLNVTVMSGDNVVCTITNTRISDCPPTTRIAANRGNGCPRDPGDPTIDPTIDDNPSVPGPAAPTADPEVAVAGDTNPLQPVDQVLAGEIERPAPADPGVVGGFLPRTGTGIAGQALLALLLMAAGLTLRLARRRRSPQA